MIPHYRWGAGDRFFEKLAAIGCKLGFHALYYKTGRHGYEVIQICDWCQKRFDIDGRPLRAGGEPQEGDRRHRGR